MKQFILILITLAFLGIIVGANVYLSKRFSWYFGLENPKLLYFLFPVLILFMMFGVIAFSNSMSVTGHLLYIFAALLMGFLLYLLLAVLLVDLGHIFIKLPPKMYGISALLLTVLVFVYSFWNANNIRTSELEVGIRGLKEEVKVMHLSDIHLGHFRGKMFMQRIVDKTKSQDVDAVFITGDLFDGRIRFSDGSLAPLAELKVPVYFIEGNHDVYSGVKEIKNSLREIGVRVLENEAVNWGEFQLIGLNHMRADSLASANHAAGGPESIRKVLPGIKTDPNKPTILLHHSPDGIQYAHEKDVDLYLAGHTHAGQLFPINYITELMFKYNKGLHDYKGTRIFVSQGTGTFGPPMRLGTRSEIAVISLIPE